MKLATLPTIAIATALLALSTGGYAQGPAEPSPLSAGAQAAQLTEQGPAWLAAYDGYAFSQGAAPSSFARVQATALMAQGHQMLAAAQAAFTTQGAYPLTLGEVLDVRPWRSVNLGYCEGSAVSLEGSFCALASIPGYVTPRLFGQGE